MFGYQQVVYISGKIIAKIVERFLDWAEERLKLEDKARPKCIVIYGLDGRLISSIVLYKDGKKEIRRGFKRESGQITSRFH